MKNILLILFVTCITVINAQYTNLLNFSGAADGNDPYASLISDGIFLYGTTSIGGINDLGSIYKIEPDGTGYVKLLDFSGNANGSMPMANLFYDGTYLFGTTNSGGLYNKGTIFKILTNGTGFQKLYDFDGILNGAYPAGSGLVFDGTFLYGSTGLGGGSNAGSIFKIKPDGTEFSTIYSFFGTTDGKLPYAPLVIDGNYLYGSTYEGGNNNIGTFFKITNDGTGFVKLMDCAGSSNGATPKGSFTLIGDELYGMTSKGGLNDKGTLFKINTDGTGYVKLLNFDGSMNGSYPQGSLILSGAFLYGMTYQGGVNNWGTAFKIKPNGSSYSKLLDFAGLSNGGYPFGSFISDGTNLYSTTRAGGTNSKGTIFKYNYCSPPSVTASASETTVCLGNSVTLNGGGASTYTWSGSVVDGVSFTPTLSELFICTGIDVNGCEDTASVYINVTDCAEIITVLEEDIEIFPNPTHDLIFIGGLIGYEIDFSLIDLTGALLLSGKTYGTIDVSEINTGVYFLQIEGVNRIVKVNIQ